jgi:hypothetical protein
MQASGPLRILLLKFVQTFMVQTGQTAIANARARIDPPVGALDLMAHDRVGDNLLPLTQNSWL